MKKRLISAAIALAIVIPLLIIGGIPLYAGIGVLAAQGYRELIKLKESHKKIPDFMQILGLLCLLLLVFMRFAGYYIVTGLSYQAITVMLLCMLIPTLFYKKDVYTTKEAFYLIGIILLLGVVFNSLIVVYNLNKWYLVYLILITTLNDSFAMIMGKLIGKHKLIPSISPNKTVEGSTCGLLIGSFISIVFFIKIIDPSIFILKIILITLILSVIGQMGDLIFSKIKRENDIKDFSNFMPGHGGLLDRLDSLSIVILAFVALIKFL